MWLRSTIAGYWHKRFELRNIINLPILIKFVFLFSMYRLSYKNDWNCSFRFYFSEMHVFLYFSYVVYNKCCSIKYHSFDTRISTMLLICSLNSFSFCVWVQKFCFFNLWSLMIFQNFILQHLMPLDLIFSLSVLLKAHL